MSSTGGRHCARNGEPALDAGRPAGAGDDLGEGGGFGLVGIGEAVRGEAVRRARGEHGYRLDGAQRRQALRAHGDAVLPAARFQAYVVTAGVVPGVGDDGDGADAEGGTVRTRCPAACQTGEETAALA
ncbi:hypothetical protein ACFZAG_41100 [Streptomyces sp. NPDC012403]|uniref:hypothetical protein n=1 Tax=Streptomyces sp. NPDC012403 TaxID=3364831 RepID=UPI0036E3DB56